MKRQGASGSCDVCPCGSGQAYERCCGELHCGAKRAETAEVLMRSRYVAYVRLLEPYLLATWAPETRPDTLALEQGGCKWLGLEVRRHAETGPDTAEVAFVARYRIEGRGQRMQETSRFRRDESGAWLYIDGDVS